MIPQLPAIRAFRRRAHLMILRKAETPPARTVTKIAGLPYLLENERWPVCSSCHQPMTFMFQIGFRDIPPGDFRIGRYDLLTFYYCLKCEPRGSHEPGGFCLRLHQISRDRPLQPATFAVRDPDANEPQECAIVFRPIEDLPPAERVVSIIGSDPDRLAEYERFVASLRGGKLRASKVGGYPHFLQTRPTVHCRCGMSMRFLAQIDSETKANLVWAGGGTLYLFYCPNACTSESVAFLIQAQ